MGIELDIYRLYRRRAEDREQLVLAKATRSEFSNSSQSAEDAACLEVNSRFDFLLRNWLSGGSTEFIAAWEGGYSEGDVFCGNASNVEIEIWLTFDTVHKGYFVFGSQHDEKLFWDALQEMHEVGSVCDLAEYSKPAQRVKVLFLQ